MRSFSSMLHRRRHSRPVMISTVPAATDLKLRLKPGLKAKSVRHQRPAPEGGSPRTLTDFSLERALSDFGTIRNEPTLAHYLDGAHKAGLHDCATREELQKYPKMTHLAACDTKRTMN